MSTRPSESDTAADDGPGFGPKDAIAIIKRRGVLIAVVWTVLALIAVGFAAALPSRYEAAATVQIDPRKRLIVNLEPVQSDLRPDTPTVESEVEVIRSRAIVTRVIDKLGLRTDPEFAGPGPIRRVLIALGISKAPPPPLSVENLSAPIDPDRDEVAAGLEKMLKVSRVRNTLLIEIRVTCGDPAKAARIANALAEAYLQEQLDAKAKATEQATGLIEARLDGLRQKLAHAERQVAMFKADNNIFDAEGQLLSEKKLARLMEQTVLVRSAAAEARAKHEQVQQLLRKGADKGAVADVLASHTVRMLKDQLVKATRREAELATKYGSLHPEMLKIRAEVADIRGQIADETRQIINNLATELKVAEDRERRLQDELARVMEQQNAAKEASVRLRELEREATSSRQVYEAFLARYKQTAETQGLELPDARIIEPAAVPLGPSSPKRKQLMAVGIVGAFVLGLIAAFAVEFFTFGFGKPEQIEQSLGVEHLASLPFLPGARRDADRLRLARMVLAEPTGAYTEAIRSLRHGLDARRRQAGSRIILVVSPQEADGKSMVAANLALHYALAGVRTLLVDGDLRRKTLSATLGVDARAGLFDAIEFGLVPQSVALNDRSTGLALMPAGGQLARLAPPEALASERMVDVLGQLRQAFDVIVMDSPALLPVVDARIAAAHADQVLFVVRWGGLDIADARRAIKALGVNARKIAGGVVNGIDLATADGVYDGEPAAAPITSRRTEPALGTAAKTGGREAA
ncbi:MAG TPA: Wzz/FepE/Etk N-terminal domain-containing protein [Hyphomicrobiaceae bacterium]|nr:Wzz/FepE/Etk N-terminal domain-containing protein [Hyphomicrobiaceae bacterium]